MKLDDQLDIPNVIDMTTFREGHDGEIHESAPRHSYTRRDDIVVPAGFLVTLVAITGLFLQVNSAAVQSESRLTAIQTKLEGLLASKEQDRQELRDLQIRVLKIEADLDRGK